MTHGSTACTFKTLASRSLFPNWADQAESQILGSDTALLRQRRRWFPPLL